jgi:hypothetical protein
MQNQTKPIHRVERNCRRELRRVTTLDIQEARQ